jgi:hypothetical protein
MPNEISTLVEHIFRIKQSFVKFPSFFSNYFKFYRFSAPLCIKLTQFWTLPMSRLLFKTPRFGNWVLSASSGGTYSGGPKRKNLSLSPDTNMAYKAINTKHQ